MRYKIIAGVALLPLLLGATSEKCTGAAPVTNETINQDDGEHELHNYGRFRFDRKLKPHSAGAACKWRVEAQWEGENGRHRIDNGSETESVYVPKPSKETTKVWLISRSCGRWDK